MEKFNPDPNDVVEQQQQNQEWEAIRRNSLRCFEVTFFDESAPEHVFAHFHDAGNEHSGHLSFVTIEPDGRHKIARLFNSRGWKAVKEIEDPTQRTQLATTLAAVERRSDQRMQELNPDQRPRRRRFPTH